MKKILITGKNSYVGTSFLNWMENFPDRYNINSLSLRNDSWKKDDFFIYDVVVHVAGLAHIKETKDNVHLYYSVNRDLAYEVAKKAKSEGVKQFIFLSSMSVYGIKSGIIDQTSPLKPKNHYGKSKLEAENLIMKLEDNSFSVVILRPPMIYGKGCKGNYKKLAHIARTSPFFPEFNNIRSMIYIDNLSKYVKRIIDNQGRGLYFPQNNEFVKTSRMVELIAKENGKKIVTTKIFNPILNLFMKHEILGKVFGSLTYDNALSKKNNTKFEDFVDFEESIRLTEE
ncbi:NAD-dependent epimerase/dehydratase family protein [Rossellomorea marisflavi]|uniref:NAD-dependent epimerase/dehydratase family protein n=1 Tax=Rossellomorea marisflavi TaxID=189381 RepID=UPI0020401C41|nr:NAD-dependent epimerase/dehydratase family protein [Rossellomorea marisflavi]MCM2590888.1 NAD-dependent epimerase/dehydratase family protein [Rossellomorea marisflavi]